MAEYIKDYLWKSRTVGVGILSVNNNLWYTERIGYGNTYRKENRKIHSGLIGSLLEVE